MTSATRIAMNIAATLLRPRLPLARCAIGLSLAACVSARADVAPVPPGFGVQERHVEMHVVYSRSQGESPNAVDRASIEKSCAVQRQLGATATTPTFEAGFDRPNRVELIQIVAPDAWASYETIHGYACDPASMGSARDACACTYRELTSRFVHIRKAAGASTEVIDAEPTRGTGTRRTRAGAYRAPEGRPDAAAFGPVVGHDVVAGMPCTIRRVDLGSGRLERCLADRVPAVPEALRDQELAQTRSLLVNGAATARDWRRTQLVQPDADIDAGVFDAPRDVAFKTVGAASREKP
jgi:hypothetical protein